MVAVLVCKHVTLEGDEHYYLGAMFEDVTLMARIIIAGSILQVNLEPKKGPPKGGSSTIGLAFLSLSFEIRLEPPMGFGERPMAEVHLREVLTSEPQGSEFCTLDRRSGPHT